MIINSPSLSLPLTGDDFTNNLNRPLIGYQNLATLANLSAGTSNALFPVRNLANPSTSARWQANDLTTQYLTADFTGAPVTMDYIGIGKHNLFTAGCTVSMEVQLTSGGSWVQQTTPQVPVDNAPLVLRMVPTLIYGVRFKMTGNMVVAAISVFYVGLLLSIPRRIYVGHSPMPLARSATVTNGRSESGNFLGRVVTGEIVSSSVTLSNLHPHWYRNNFDPFVKVSRETPFFFAWRPGDYPLETAFCWITNIPVPQNQLSNGMMSVALQFGGISTP